MYLVSEWIVPITENPVHHYALLIVDGIIQKMMPASEVPASAQIINLGDSVLLPGLVNAHAHLEFSNPHIQSSPISFTEWAKSVRSTGIQVDQTDMPLQAIQRLLETGTTLIADHCSPYTPYFETPFRRVLFWEVLGAQKDRAEESWAIAREKSRKHGGYITPHSLYAVHETILQALRGSSLQSIHLLESADEDRFFRKRSGPLADFVTERGGDLPFSSTSPIEWIAQRQISPPPPLIVHGNYLTDDELGLVKDMGSTIVHCPGSHAYFGHKPFPLAKALERGIPVALGTDSRASNEDLSMFREMRLLHASAKSQNIPLSEADILKMATLSGAKALGLADTIGSIEVGKKADLIAVSHGTSLHALQNVLNAEKVSFSMINGRIIFNNV